MKKFLPGVLAAFAALAVLVLVPTSPALLVDAPQVLAASSVDEWGMASGLVITAYSLILAVSTFVAFLGVHASLKKKTGSGTGAMLALVSGVSALCVSHWLFCALRWGYVINDLGETPAFLLTFWKGGYTMYGAILGGMLGAFIFAKVRKLNVASTMDSLMPGAALMIAAGRFGEHFTLQGRGTYVVNEALSMIPFVSQNEWGETQVPVYVYEGLVAAVALIVMLVMLRRKAPAGRAAETGLTIISAAQVMLDSWRGDELIRFGFVRLNMICAAVTLLGLMILRVMRAVKADGKANLWTVLRVVLLFLGAGAVLVVEFGLDGKMGIMTDNTLLYAIQAAAVTMMGAVVLIDGKKVK